jgi:hypothetical protein
LGFFFHGKSYALIVTKKRVGLRFRRFFHKLIWSPCLCTSSRAIKKPFIALMALHNSHQRIGAQKRNVHLSIQTTFLRPGANPTTSEFTTTTPALQ